MAITASIVLTKASKILQDETNVRWPLSTEMLGWLDSALRTVAIVRPELFTTTASRQLSAGTRQVLPASAIGLSEVVRNMGPAGTTPGKTINQKPKHVLDVLLPDWHKAIPSQEVHYYCAEKTRPREYQVYPPQPATGMGYVEERLYVAPAALSVVGDTLPLDETYESVLIDLVLSQAFAKDSESPTSAARAENHRKMALETLALQIQAQGSSAPEAQ